VASKPTASLSLDVDNLWSYLKVRGDESWRERPTYLPTFVPHVLEVLDRLGIRITFFLVGADATDDRNKPHLRALTAGGHEVGNHSFEHEPWLHTYTPEAVRKELGDADAAIHAATGQRPIGFRGPGFSWSTDVLSAVAEQGYAFDASTFPTFLGPLARTYYFWTAKLSREEREERKALFGSFSEGFRPLRPYRWSLPGGRELLEIPVTTMPMFKVPFHVSYLLYLARFSVGLMSTYLATALAMCKATRTEPSILLHPLDVLGGDQVPQLRFFPGMDLPAEEKTRLFIKIMEQLARGFELVPMGEHARRLAQRPLPTRVPG
jgi:hypothetical protein